MFHSNTQSGLLTYENTESYIDIDGLRIHYHEAGTTNGRVVVFLHGGGLGASGWFNFHRNIEPFSEEFHVILIDMPNYGGSDSIVLTDVDVAQFDAQILSRFLQEKRIEKASLVGNSKGGMDAIAFSVHHPEQLEALVLMGSHAGASIFDPMPATGTVLLFDIFRHPTREKMEQVMRLFFFDESIADDDFVDIRWKDASEADARGQRAAIVESQPLHVDYTSQLGAVPHPVLVLYGAHDRFSSFDSSASLMRNYPNSELHVFRNCGHWVQYELADDFNKITTRWLVDHISSGL